MKKRALSLLLACFMVVSTFIISRPIVDVHAVETPDFVEGENQWTLDYNWSKNLDPKDKNGWELASKNNGIWRLSSFSDPANTETIRWDASADGFTLVSGSTTSVNGKSPQSYIESYYNRSCFTSVAATWDSWYVNYNHRHQSISFSKGNNTDYMYVIPGNASYNHAAIVFTAPSNGVYSYTEIVEQVEFAYGDAPVTMTATVRKNGAVLNSFTPTSSAASKTLDGSVYLEEGDLLTFVFSEDTSNANLKDSTKYVKISGVVVKKIANTTTNYSMPLAWVDGCEQGTGSYVVPKKGDWRLTSFSDPGNIKTLVWNGSNQPWMNNSQNASTTSFYVNGTGKWANGTVFNKGVEGEYILAIPYGKYGRTSGNVDTNISGSNPTALFTAPVSGEYAYSEIMRGVTMTDVNGTPVTVTATVRKNGEVLDTVNISAENPYASNAGTVTLEAGDFLMFVFVLDQTDARIKDHTDFIRLYAADVALVAAAPVYENSVELPIIFDGTSFTDKYGMVELMGYSDATGAPYKDGIAITTFEGKWYVYEPDGKSTYYGNPGKDNYLWAGSLSTGLLTNVGGDFRLPGIGSTLVFTAPYDGIFKFESTMDSSWPTSYGGAWSEYIIRKEDGTILSSATNRDKGSHTTNDTTVKATVELVKGEKVYIIRRPTGEGTSINTSCGGNATITITDLNHTCSSKTVKHIAAVTPGCEDGNVEYWACACGINYADANATTTTTGSVVLPGKGHADSTEWGHDATQHWMYCANGCGELRVEKTNHTWENSVCSVCKYECKHENANVANCVSASVCPVCKVELAPINPNNHATQNTVHANGNGTHKFVHICCDSDSVTTEDCAYDEDGICVVCGFDGSALIEIENNINNAYDNIFNNGTGNVTAQGPANGALNNYVTKTEGTDVPEVEYVKFNINHEGDRVTLRHHFVITPGTEYTITLNGEPVTLTQSQGSDVWYLDVPKELGKYGEADEICVNGTVTYTVSIYSYIKKALASDEVGENEKAYLKALYDANEEANKVEPVYVAMANQNPSAGGRSGVYIDIYDISTGNMNNIVWTYKTSINGVSGFKVRKHATYGEVLLVTVGKKAEMVDMDTKTVVWSTGEASDNSHSIELLPNGVIVTGGTVGNSITFFNTNGADASKCLLEIKYPDAHGVLYDPKYDVVWVAGTNQLSAYKVTLNPDGSVSAVKDENLSVVTPEGGLHDLQPYFGNDDCLIISTGSYVRIYDKVSKTFIALVNQPHTKGVGVLPNGDVIYMYHDELPGSEGWNTTLINRIDSETGVTTQIKSNQGRFYKCRVLNFNYQ